MNQQISFQKLSKLSVLMTNYQLQHPFVTTTTKDPWYKQLMETYFTVAAVPDFTPCFPVEMRNSTPNSCLVEASTYHVSFFPPKMTPRKRILSKPNTQLTVHRSQHLISPPWQHVAFVFVDPSGMAIADLR